MRLFVRDVVGQTLSLQVEGQDTVEQVKGQICELQGLPVDEQKLIFAGRTLDSAERRPCVETSQLSGDNDF
ncbi:unnamed protein product [Cladocopium goreaui]|uniref:Ubiquitin-like domain-containing protein n=1 Tax=Cladocopium goreaui TaxID=2562237 RepID=A0A9P1CSM5_9DINO|nr:unnamed protein product [Cladocopium goreaui]